jgi:TRAP-type C4-dicarboxylate transport system substrate-binding protein
MPQPIRVRWLIAHQPQELFLRTARAFQQELDRTIPGQIEIEILTYPDYAAKYGEIPDLDGLNQIETSEKVPQALTAFWNCLRGGAFEMSQIQVNRVGDICKDFSALDLPFLFDDHDHVSRVVDGEIGKELCAKLTEQTDIRGLGFTYSGGYRVIGSNHAINSLDELQGLKVVVENDISIGHTLQSMGTNTVIIPPSLWKKTDPVGTGLGDAVETTYLRFSGSHVLKTNHSMFMTTVLIGNGFWNKLDAVQQQAFNDAAKIVATLEREWSINDAEQYEKSAEQRGVKIIELNSEERAQLKKKAMLSYFRTKYLFSPDLVRRIRTQR